MKRLQSSGTCENTIAAPSIPQSVNTELATSRRPFDPSPETASASLPPSNNLPCTMQSSLLRSDHPDPAPDRRVIRLLVVASETGGRLTCKLIQANVTTERVALSYVWRTSKSQHTTNVQGQDSTDYFKGRDYGKRKATPLQHRGGAHGGLV